MRFIIVALALMAMFSTASGSSCDDIQTGKFSNLLANNLGGKGPQKNDEKAIIYENYLQVNNKNVNLKIEALTPYVPGKVSNNGIMKNKEFGIINMKNGKKVTLEFSFIDHKGQSVTVPELYFTFYDIDQNGKKSGGEKISICGADALKTTATNKLKRGVGENGCPSFSSTKKGADVNNPTSAAELSQAQKDVSVSAHFTNTKSFRMTMDFAGKKGGRNVMFSTVGVLCKEEGGESGPQTGGKDPCAQNNGKCHTFATCENDNGKAKCTCNEGYVGNGRKCKLVPTPEPTPLPTPKPTPEPTPTPTPKPTPTPPMTDYMIYIGMSHGDFGLEKGWKKVVYNGLKGLECPSYVDTRNWHMPQYQRQPEDAFTVEVENTPEGSVITVRKVQGWGWGMELEFACKAPAGQSQDLKNTGCVFRAWNADKSQMLENKNVQMQGKVYSTHKGFPEGVTPPTRISYAEVEGCILDLESAPGKHVKDTDINGGKTCYIIPGKIYDVRQRCQYIQPHMPINGYSVVYQKDTYVPVPDSLRDRFTAVGQSGTETSPTYYMGFALLSVTSFGLGYYLSSRRQKNLALTEYYDTLE